MNNLTPSAPSSNGRSGFANRIGPFLLTLLTAAALLAALALAGLLLILPRVSGLENMIIATGSMHPAFGAGDLALVDRAVPAEDVEAGDVITYFDPQGRLVTHRVIEVMTSPGGELLFQTKGDANAGPDNYVVPAGAYQGRIERRLPYMGHVLNFVRQREVVYAAIFIPAGMIILTELRSIFSPALNRREEERG